MKDRVLRAINISHLRYVPLSEVCSRLPDICETEVMACIVELQGYGYVELIDFAEGPKAFVSPEGIHALAHGGAYG